MFITINDINLYYEKYGTGKKEILIIPGWGNTRPTFTYMINFLKIFFTVYIIDLPGFGNSTFPNRNLNIYDYAELINSFIKLKLNNPFLIGHSFGCRVIIALCGFLNYKPDKILLFNAAGIRKKYNIFNLIKIYTYKLLKKFQFLFKNKETYLKKLSKIFGSNDYNNLPNNMKKTFINVINEDLTKYLDNITCETLLIWGKKDKDTPLSYAKTIKKHIKNSELIIYPNAKHFSYLDNIALTNSIVYKYLI